MVIALGEGARVFLMGTAACIAIGAPLVRTLARRQGRQPARYEDCPPLSAYQQSKRAVPTLGGIFVLFAGALVAASCGGLSHPSGWVIAVALLIFAAIGLVDDLLKFRGANARGLRTIPKLLMTLAAGGGIGWVIGQQPWAPALELPGIGMHRAVVLGWGWLPLATLVLAGSTHAVNLTDGMDGLATGLSAIVLAALAMLAHVPSAPVTVAMIWSTALAGACLGFLWFNSYPASVFLGDVGALGIGAAIGAIALVTGSALWLILIGGLFVLEALSVILQVASYKWRNKRRVFRVAPVHHHFHLGGISEPKLIVRFWIVGVVLAAVAWGMAAE